MDWLANFVDEPDRLIAWGRGTFIVGAAGIVFGLIGRVARGGTAAIQSPGHTAPTSWPSLAEIYPQLWTWWVPESLLGAVPYLLVGAAGIWMALTGRKYKRVFH